MSFLERIRVNLNPGIILMKTSSNRLVGVSALAIIFLALSGVFWYSKPTAHSSDRSPHTVDANKTAILNWTLKESSGASAFMKSPLSWLKSFSLKSILLAGVVFCVVIGLIVTVAVLVASVEQPELVDEETNKETDSVQHQEETVPFMSAAIGIIVFILLVVVAVIMWKMKGGILGGKVEEVVHIEEADDGFVHISPTVDDAKKGAEEEMKPDALVDQIVSSYQQFKTSTSPIEPTEDDDTDLLYCSLIGPGEPTEHYIKEHPGQDLRHYNIQSEIFNQNWVLVAVRKDGSLVQPNGKMQGNEEILVFDINADGLKQVSLEYRKHFHNLKQFIELMTVNQ